MADNFEMTNPISTAKQQATMQRIAGSVAGIAFWQHNPVTDVITRTPQLDAICGLPEITEEEAAQPIPGPYYSDLVPDEDQELLAKVMGGLVAEGIGAFREVEHRIIRPNGEERNVLVRCELTKDDAEGEMVIVGSTLDVTDLRANEKRLDALVQQKNLLLGEVNHRVKNSLQLVSSILALEARSASENEKAKLLSAATRIQAVSAVHSSFYHGDDSKTVEFSEHLKDFCAQLSESFGTAARGIDLKVTAERACISADRAVPLSLLINELVTNSLKHGLSGETSNGFTISVSLQPTGTGRLLLVIADDGRTDRADAEKTEEDALPIEGIGTRLISTVVRQIEADIRVNKDQGWRTEIEFTP